jgi:hypothetical protein
MWSRICTQSCKSARCRSFDGLQPGCAYRGKSTPGSDNAHYNPDFDLTSIIGLEHRGGKVMFRVPEIVRKIPLRPNVLGWLRQSISRITGARPRDTPSRRVDCIDLRSYAADDGQDVSLDSVARKDDGDAIIRRFWQRQTAWGDVLPRYLEHRFHATPPDPVAGSRDRPV